MTRCNASIASGNRSFSPVDRPTSPGGASISPANQPSNPAPGGAPSAAGGNDRLWASDGTSTAAPGDASAPRRAARSFARRLILITALLAPALAGVACDRTADPRDGAAAATLPADEPGAQRLRAVTMTLGGKPVTLEVADDPGEQQIGLMHRRSMPAGHGMLFVFPVERELSFYMRNTLIPLDIVYVNADGRIVSIHQMKPMDETDVPSDGPAKFAIELNLNAAHDLGLKPGDRVTIPGEARDPQ